MSKKHRHLKNKMMVTTAMVGAFFGGYSRNAYAACTNSGGSTYLCTGANVATQTINANDAAVTTAPGFGVSTNTMGSGAVVITGNGAISFADNNSSTIENTDGFGIQITSAADNGGTAGSTNLVLGTGSKVISRRTGVGAKNYGRGELNITINGDVSSDLFGGVRAKNYNGTDLIITVGQDSVITSNGLGIEAVNEGTGILDVILDGYISSIGNGGLSARNYGGTSVYIVTGADSVINSFDNGILATTGYTVGVDNKMVITANGDITSYNGSGIVALLSSYGTDLTITTSIDSVITAQSYGVTATNSGTGKTSLIIDGDITSTAARGVSAYVDGDASDIELTIGADSVIDSYGYGVHVYNLGKGESSITINGDIKTTNGIGLNAYNGATSTDLTVTAGSTSKIEVGSSYTGVNITNSGTGKLSATLDGQIYGGQGASITNRGADMVVSTGASSKIVSDHTGVNLRNEGTGKAEFTLDGDVYATNYQGVRIDADSGSSDLILTIGSTANIESSHHALSVFNDGTGKTDLTISGTLSSSDKYGIYARNTYNSTDLIVNITGGSVVSEYGVRAWNYGTGELIFNTKADIATASAFKSGLFLTNSTGTGLTLTADGTISGSAGVIAYNFSGNATITVNGDINATDANYGTGLFVRSNALDLDITVGGNITGQYGIFVQNEGSGDANINITGNVTGGKYSGLHVDTHYSSLVSTNINISNGGSVSGFNGIKTNSTTLSNILMDGSTKAVSVTGTGGTAFILGDLDDTLTFIGDVSIDGDIDGGAGNDKLNLDAANVTLSAGSKFRGIEDIILNGISTINGDFDSTGSNIKASGGNLHVNGNFTASSLTVDNGTTLGGNNTLTTDLIIDSGGTLAPGNSVGTINVVGNVTFNTGSFFDVEVDVGGADRLNATGDITIQPGVTLNLIPLGSFAGSSVTFLDAGGTLTGTFDTVNKNGLAADLIYNVSNAQLTFSVVTASPVATNTQALASLESGAIFVDTLSEMSSQNVFDRENNYWIKGIYRSSSRDTDGNLNGFDNNVYGVAAGAEYKKNDRWKIGYSLANLENNTDINSGIGDTDGNASFVSVYATWAKERENAWDLFATMGAMGGYHDYNTSRKVSNAGVISDAKGESQSYEAGALLEFGARAEITKDWMVSPKIGLNYIHIFAEGYKEDTGGAAAVSIEDYNFGTLRPSANLSIYNNTGLTIPYTDLKVKPHANAGVFYEHALTNRQIEGNFSSGTGFRMDLDERNNTFGTIGLGADVDIVPGVVGFINYQHSTSAEESRNDGRIGVKVEF